LEGKMRVVWICALIAGGLLLGTALIVLQPASPVGPVLASAPLSDPVVPVITAERFLHPGAGMYPGVLGVHPVSGEVWVCRNGGWMTLRGAEIRSIQPGSCDIGFHAQTPRWFRAEGRSVVIMSGTTPVGQVTLPYTVTGIVLHPRTQLLYVGMQRFPYPPISTDLAVISGTTVLTIMNTPGVGHLAPHPESGDVYVGVNTYGPTPEVWILSGTQRVVTFTMTGVLHWIEYHPYSRLTYVSSRDELKVLNGRMVLASLSVTETFDFAPDPDSERAYLTHLIPRWITVLSRTEVITRVPFPHGYNPIAVIPRTGEIVAGAFFSQQIHVFSRDLTLLNVISMPVRPRQIFPREDGWVYVAGWGESFEGSLPSDLLVLSRTVPVAEYPNGFGLGSLARSPDGRLYVLDLFTGRFDVLSGTEVVTSTAFSPWSYPILLPQERRLEADPGTGWAYVALRGSVWLWIWQGEGWLTRSLPSGISVLRADPHHGVIFGGKDFYPVDEIYVITGTEIFSLPIEGGLPGPVRDLAVDPSRDYLYVGGLGQVAVLSLTTPLTASRWLTTVSGMYPLRALAAHPGTGMAYVGSGLGPTGTLWILSGPTPVISMGVEGVPVALAAAPGGPWVYVALSGTQRVAVLSGTDRVATVTLPFEPLRIWVSPRSGLAYVAGETQVAVLRGPQVWTQLTTGIYPRDMVFDPERGIAVLSHEGDNRLVWIEERALTRRLWLPLILRGR
jgi:DNA-binding beta-propeller fold protein YncE